MGIIIEIAKFVINVIYMFFKLFKTKNKITFLSRQSDNISIDFFLLKNEIEKVENKLQIVILTKKIGKGIKGKILYGFHILKQMYHVATSRVVIIDGYQIVISVLKHKKNLKVIQIWHALGSLKKFGYSVKDKKEGSKAIIIDKMNMHKNYTYAIASSKIAAKNFANAFNMDSKKVLVMGLPRIDYLKSEIEKNNTKNKIILEYPNLKNGKKNILYVPTFRKNTNSNLRVNDIIDNVDYNKYNLIVKLHSGMEYIYIDSAGDKIEGNKFTGMEMIHIADYVITDYSAISFEVMVANKPVYYYIYDFEDYKDARDMYIDFKAEMPGFMSKDAKDILKAIDQNITFKEKTKKFINKYISCINEENTKELVELIMKLKGV